MGKILRAFVLDELELEPVTDYDSEETKAARERAGRLEDLFTKTLREEQREAYEKLEDARLEAEYLYNIDRMIFGYRLGVLMTAEVFTDKEELLCKGRPAEWIR